MSSNKCLRVENDNLLEIVILKENQNFDFIPKYFGNNIFSFKSMANNLCIAISTDLDDPYNLLTM